MRKTKAEKGITLIALLITIILLLIIAGVTISSINGDGILLKAQHIANISNQSVENEQDIINKYMGYFNNISTDVTTPSETAEIEIGSYVDYNLPYKDMYSELEYTSTTGWRYLGTDDEGNKLIVSTAIPAILWYHTDGTGGAASWWASESEVEADTGIYQTTETSDNAPHKYAAYGLRYKFENIPYTYTQPDYTNVELKNNAIHYGINNINYRFINDYKL